MRRHFKKDSGMESNISDASLILKRVGLTLLGACATYMDVKLHVGNTEYLKLIHKTEKRFSCKNSRWSNTNFTGIPLEKLQNESIFNRKDYFSKTSILKAGVNFSDSRSLIAKLAWALNYKRSICYTIALLA